MDGNNSTRRNIIAYAHHLYCSARVKYKMQGIPAKFLEMIDYIDTSPYKDVIITAEVKMMTSHKPSESTSEQPYCCQ